MKYIEALREGERIQEIYLCKQKNVAMTKTGKEYENVILQDKTGSLDAKIWDPRSMGIDDFDALDYVEVSGDVTLMVRHSYQLKEQERQKRENMILLTICLFQIRILMICLMNY